jgi:hypothetical protein
MLSDGKEREKKVLKGKIFPFKQSMRTNNGGVNRATENKQQSLKWSQLLRMCRQKKSEKSKKQQSLSTRIDKIESFLYASMTRK